MADVRKAYLHAFQHGQALAIAAGAQKAERALGVFQVVDRLHGRAAGALGLARLPFRVRDLYVGAVAQHDLQKVAGLLRGVDGAAEAALVEQRQVAGMVDVGVRDEDAEQRLGPHGKEMCIRDSRIGTLEHTEDHQAVVDQHRVADFQFLGEVLVGNRDALTVAEDVFGGKGEMLAPVEHDAAVREAAGAILGALGVEHDGDGHIAVSYTHLDVYKRQWELFVYT